MGTTVSTEWVDAREKRGRNGRRFVAAERRRELLAAFRASGLTRRAFARQEGIRYTTFCAWVRWAEPADRRPVLALIGSKRRRECHVARGTAR